MSFHLPCGLMQANTRSRAPEDITPWSRKFCWKDNGALLHHRLTLILDERAEQMTAYLNAWKLLSGMESWDQVAGSERLNHHRSLLEGAAAWEMLSCNLCLSVQTFVVISWLLSFSAENRGEMFSGCHHPSLGQSLKKMQTFTTAVRRKVTGSRVCCILGWRVTEIPLDTVARILTHPGKVKHTAQCLLGVQRQGVFLLALKYIPENLNTTVQK